MLDLMSCLSLLGVSTASLPAVSGPLEGLSRDSLSGGQLLRKSHCRPLSRERAEEEPRRSQAAVSRGVVRKSLLEGE